MNFLPFPFIFPFHSFSFIPCQPPSAPCRLLKVKPEERLTIEGVLAHPWLNCTEALDNVLPSAQMMMDKVSGKLIDACGRLKKTKRKWPHTKHCLEQKNRLNNRLCWHPRTLPGGGCRNPAGPRRAVGQHENSRSERQPEAPKFCQQPNPQEAQTAGVRRPLLNSSRLRGVKIPPVVPAERCTYAAESQRLPEQLGLTCEPSKVCNVLVFFTKTN